MPIKVYDETIRVLKSAVQKAKLPIHLEEVLLTPTPDLVSLVKKSMEIAAVDAGEGQ